MSRTVEPIKDDTHNALPGIPWVCEYRSCISHATKAVKGEGPEAGLWGYVCDKHEDKAEEIELT
jgi:hypothetical protein